MLTLLHEGHLPKHNLTGSGPRFRHRSTSAHCLARPKEGWNIYAKSMFLYTKHEKFKNNELHLQTTFLFIPIVYLLCHWIFLFFSETLSSDNTKSSYSNIRNKFELSDIASQTSGEQTFNVLMNIPKNMYFLWQKIERKLIFSTDFIVIRQPQLLRYTFTRR